MAVRIISERVTFSMRSKLREELREHPETFGLPRGGSESSRLNELLEAGARLRKEQARHAAQTKLYEQMADDPEYTEAVEHSTRSAFEDGLL